MSKEKDDDVKLPLVWYLLGSTAFIAMFALGWTGTIIALFQGAVIGFLIMALFIVVSKITRKLKRAKVKSHVRREES